MSCDEEQVAIKDTFKVIPAFDNPLIQNDAFFTGSHWNDPHVMLVNDTFIMYASSDISWDLEVKIYRLISSDGIAWEINPTTPVLDKSVDSWDSHSVETPSVVLYQDVYHLFYTGYDVETGFSNNGTDGISGTLDDDNSSKHYKVGHATSVDGINFIKQGFILEPTAPYSDINLDFNQFLVAEPAAVIKDGKILLYFTAMGADIEVNATWQVIGLTTYDGDTWDEPRVALKPDLNNYPREQYIGYSTPAALNVDGEIHLYYDVAIDVPWTQVKIHHASSSNGENQWGQDNETLMSREDYDWTTAEIRAPSALIYNDLLYLYFAGHVLSPEINLAIGLEIMDHP